MQQFASLLRIRSLIGDLSQRETTYFQYLKIQGCCLRCAVSKDHVFTRKDFLSVLSHHHYNANSNIVVW